MKKDQLMQTFLEQMHFFGMKMNVQIRLTLACSIYMHVDFESRLSFYCGYMVACYLYLLQLLICVLPHGITNCVFL